MNYDDYDWCLEHARYRCKCMDTLTDPAEMWDSFNKDD